jgi:RNA polymerase sigma-70 factor (ECF subfamily)
MSSLPLTRPSLLLSLRNAGNDRAWRDFVEIYAPLIFGHCTRRGLQEADAADVTQEVMRSVARAIQKLDYDRARGTFRAWLLTVTRSKLNNFFASRARHPQGTGETAVVQFLEAQPGPEAAADWDREYRRRLFQIASEKVQKEVQAGTWAAFWQTAVEDEPAAAVAAELGMTTGAVYIARSRVLARLRTEIESLDRKEDISP